MVTPEIINKVKTFLEENKIDSDELYIICKRIKSEILEIVFGNSYETIDYFKDDYHEYNRLLILMKID